MLIKWIFFDYDISNKYESIIGNPPYVKYNNIGESTKSKLDHTLLDNRSNLYLFFIEKCIKQLTDNGELIFIVPRDFLKATSSRKLNKFIYDSGTITDVVDYGDMILFKGFSPNCIIFRFEKGNFSRKTIYEDVVNNVINERNFSCSNGQIYFLSNDYDVNFCDLFFVKVGGVSGADDIFRNLAIFPKVDMNMEEVCDMLNSVDWNELGFMCDGRYLFSQRSLENCKLPHLFDKYIKREISLW